MKEKMKMMNSSAEIINLLQGIFLEGKEIRQLPIDGFYISGLCVAYVSCWNDNLRLKF